MNLAMAEFLAKDLMKEHGLISKGWTFKFDRAVSRFGQTKQSVNRSTGRIERTISLSKPLTEKRDEMKVRNTILHEIAHALVGVQHGHDIVWKRQAMAIGCDGQRCSEIAPEERVKPNYAVVCTFTGGQHVVRTQMRKSSIAERAVCGKHRSPLKLVKVP